MTDGRLEGSRHSAAIGGHEAKLVRTDFGTTGYAASRLGFGGMELSGPPRSVEISEGQSIRVLHAAFDFGINYFDTSIDYGLSEERIGVAFKGRRENIILATKCGCDVSNGSGEHAPHVYTPENIRKGVAQSLKRLRTDYIDVMQLHGNPTVEQLESQGGLDALIELRDKGVIRQIGLSTRKPYLKEFVDLDILNVFQLPYSAIQRQHEDIAEALSAKGKAIVARGVTARGSVAKGWTVTPVGMKEGQAQSIWEVAKLDELLDGMSRIEFMIRFALTSPALSLCLVGTTNVSHLEANILASERGPLDADLYHQALKRLTEAGSAPGDAEYARGGPKPPQRPR